MIWNRPHDRKGFALPAVLAVTGVVTLVFLVAITALASLNAEARSARDRIRFIQNALTAEASIVYLASTNPLDGRGVVIGGPRTLDRFEAAESAEGEAETAAGTLATLQLDGRPYRLDGPWPLAVAIQDQGGMINLANLDVFAQRRLYRRLGIADNETANLTAALRDYVDTDDLRQINGAETAQYDGGGPANRPLRRAVEWLAVKGARSSVNPTDWRRIRPLLIYDNGFSALNVNTMQAATMEVLFDISPSQAEAAIEARATTPFLSINAFEQAVGEVNLGDPETLYAFPAGRMIYTIRDGRSPWLYRGRLSLTPSNAEQPFWIDQTEQAEAPRRAVAPITDALPFPDPPR